MGKIKIIRPWEFSSIFRKYKIHINNSEAGFVKNGQTTVLNVPNSINNIHITIDWCSSKTVEFISTAETTTHFECGSIFKGWNLFKVKDFLTTPEDWIYLKTINKK